MDLLNEIRALRGEWRRREELRHAHLSPTDIVPTMASAGEWSVTYPSSCRLTCVVPYLPAHADDDGWASELERELHDRIVRAAAADDLLTEHPPAIAWSAGVMPMEIGPDAAIAVAARDAADELSLPGGIAGLDSWFDGATFTRFASTPTVAFGPSGLDGDRTVAHTIDEFVAVDDLVRCAQALALTALRFCR